MRDLQLLFIRAQAQTNARTLSEIIIIFGKTKAETYSKNSQTLKKLSPGKDGETAP